MRSAKQLYDGISADGPLVMRAMPPILPITSPTCDRRTPNPCFFLDQHYLNSYTLRSFHLPRQDVLLYNRSSSSITFTTRSRPPENDKPLIFEVVTANDNKTACLDGEITHFTGNGRKMERGGCERKHERNCGRKCLVNAQRSPLLS